MYIALFIFIPIFSLALAWFFISRDAKKFAQSPPAPLLDMDRLYDNIFSSLDEETGSAVTPAELQAVLSAFVNVLVGKGIVAEDVKSADVKDDLEMTPESVVAQIRKDNPELGVAHFALVNIVQSSLSYLKGINALS